jgi:hypothetical protein
MSRISTIGCPRVSTPTFSPIHSHSSRRYLLLTGLAAPPGRRPRTTLARFDVGRGWCGANPVAQALDLGARAGQRTRAALRGSDRGFDASSAPIAGPRSWGCAVPKGVRRRHSYVVLRVAAPRLSVLEGKEEAAVVELLAELLLEAVRAAALVPSAGPALIDADQEED